MNDGVCGAARGCQGRQEAAKGCKPPHGAVMGLCRAVRGCARGCAVAVRGLCARLCGGCAGAVRGCTGTNMCCQLHAAAVLCMVEVSEGKSPSVTA